MTFTLARACLLALSVTRPAIFPVVPARAVDESTRSARPIAALRMQFSILLMEYIVRYESEAGVPPIGRPLCIVCIDKQTEASPGGLASALQLLFQKNHFTAKRGTL